MKIYTENGRIKTASLTNKQYYLERVERIASDIINEGEDLVDDVISIIGKVIDRHPNIETVRACEKLIEVLNEGPEIRTIGQLTEEQSRFASELLANINGCLKLTV